MTIMVTFACGCRVGQLPSETSAPVCALHGTSRIVRVVSPPPKFTDRHGGVKGPLVQHGR